MAVYFTLNQNGEMVDFLAIDKMLCEQFKVECDKKEWFHQWYDLVGFSLAAGLTWDTIRDINSDSETMLKVIDFLEDNFTVERGYCK